MPKALTIGGLLVVAALGFPFLVGEVYQPSGGNIDEFTLPPSFESLQEYFDSGSAGPVYNVLVLPLSASTGVYMSFENQSFTDSSLLLSSFVPYPLIQMNTGPVVSDFENYLAENESNSLVPILDSMSVRFVVLNPFANATEYWMSHAPDGLPINYPEVQARIATELGSPQSAGAFTVFQNPSALPIVRVGNQLPTLATPSYPQFLSTLGDLNSLATPVAKNLSESTWENASCADFSNLCAVQVTPYGASVVVPEGDSFAVVSSGGDVSEYNGSSPSGLPQGFTFFDGNRSLVASPSLRATIANSSSIETDLSEGNNSLLNSLGSTGFVGFKGNLSVPSLVSISLSTSQLNVNDWISASFSSGLVQLLVQVYINTSSDAVTFTEAAYYMDRAYAWDVGTSSGPENGSATMRAMIFPTSISAAVWETSGLDQQLPPLNFSGTGIRSNEGYNTSSEPANPVVIGNFTTRLTIVNAATEVSAFTISTPVDAKDVIIANGTSDFLELPAAITVEPSGNFRVACLSTSPSSKVVVWINYPVNSLWTATSNQFAISKLGGVPYANAFLAIPNGPGSFDNDTITLVLSVSLDVGLYIDFGLGLVLGSILVAALVIPCVARHRLSRSLRPSGLPGTPVSRPASDGQENPERDSVSPEIPNAEVHERKRTE